MVTQVFAVAPWSTLSKAEVSSQKPKNLEPEPEPIWLVGRFVEKFHISDRWIYFELDHLDPMRSHRAGLLFCVHEQDIRGVAFPVRDGASAGAL